MKGFHFTVAFMAFFIFQTEAKLLISESNSLEASSNADNMDLVKGFLIGMGYNSSIYDNISLCLSSMVGPTRDVSQGLFYLNSTNTRNSVLVFGVMDLLSSVPYYIMTNNYLCPPSSLDLVNTLSAVYKMFNDETTFSYVDLPPTKFLDVNNVDVYQQVQVLTDLYGEKANWTTLGAQLGEVARLVYQGYQPGYQS